MFSEKSAKIEIRCRNILRPNLHQQVKFGIKSGLGIFDQDFRLVKLQLTHFSQNGKIAKIRKIIQDLGRMTS